MRPRFHYEVGTIFQQFRRPHHPQNVWLANGVVRLVEVIVTAIAAAGIEQFAGETAADLTTNVLIVVFLYPGFVIALKRAHDCDIPNAIHGY